MSDNHYDELHYDTLEGIFTIPDDVDTRQKEDLIASVISRIKATISLVGVAVQTEDDIPVSDICNTLWMVEDQLDQLEKLINFEVKEDKS